MELFRDDGCMTDEGLHALLDGRLDELGRLEAAEHLAYCNPCLERYTALLAGAAVEQPPQSLQGPVLCTVWTTVMQNVYGRIAVAGVAAVLALTMWRGGAFDLIITGREYLTSRAGQDSVPPGSAISTLWEHTESIVDNSVGRVLDAWDTMLDAVSRPGSPDKMPDKS